jgi:purine-binding chemotaxis protein CheW
MRGERTGRDPKVYCLFTWQSRPFAIALEFLAGVVEPDRLVTIPLCPPKVVGVCAVRRAIVPVLCLEEGDGCEAEAQGTKLLALLLSTKQGAWCLLIDRGGVMVVAEPNALHSVSPATYDANLALDRIERSGTSYAILDPERIWLEQKKEMEREHAMVSSLGPSLEEVRRGHTPGGADA